MLDQSRTVGTMIEALLAQDRIIVSNSTENDLKLKKRMNVIYLHI